MGRREGVEPGSQETFLRPSPFETLAERGWPMKKIPLGAFAALLAAMLLAAPAQAANVTVRVEGETQTLLPRSAVATDGNPVLVDGSNSCRGTSAGGALYKAVGGDMGGSWGSFGFLLKTIKGETHDDPFPADPAEYWSFWVNYRFQDQGLCGTELQEGDDVIMLVDCYSAKGACAPASPLRLSNVPPTMARGQSLTVRVDEYGVEDPTAFPTVTTSGPAAGATVNYGTAAATTGPDGTAQLTFTEPGLVSIRVSKPDRVRTAGLTCVTTGSDGNCGTQLPPGAVLGTENPDDKSAPVASFSRLRNGKVYKRERAPRKI